MLIPGHINSPNPEEEKLLRSLVCGRDSPGPILKDFELLLDTIGESGVQVSASQYRLKPDTIRYLNERISRPLQAQFKRIQQKSYPYIYGLYLIFRCSGLCRITHEGSKHFMRIDRDGIAAWDALSDIDQYFHLLYTWLFRVDEEMILERRNRSPWTNLSRCHSFIEDFKRKESVQVKADKHYNDRIRYTPGLANLAMMDLFGLVNIEEKVTKDAKGWNITRVKKEPWAMPFLNVLVQVQLYYMSTEDFFVSEVEIPAPSHAQEWLQNYFPEWKQLLSIEGEAFTPSKHIFKVSWEKTWRRIAVSGASMLKELAHGILRAYEFEDWAHLYRFTYQDAHAQIHHVDHEYSDTPRSTSEVRIGDLPIKEGDKLQFIFDFGDWWEFELLLENLEPENIDSKKTVLLESHGDSPPQYYWADEDEEDW